jgi:hypothetical protein
VQGLVSASFPYTQADKRPIIWASQRRKERPPQHRRGAACGPLGGRWSGVCEPLGGALERRRPGPFARSLERRPPGRHAYGRASSQGWSARGTTFAWSGACGLKWTAAWELVAAARTSRTPSSTAHIAIRSGRVPARSWARRGGRRRALLCHAPDWRSVPRPLIVTVRRPATPLPADDRRASRSARTARSIVSSRRRAGAGA